MRRIIAAISAALLLGSSATAILAAELFVVDRSGVPVRRTIANASRQSTLAPSSPNVVRLNDRYAVLYPYELRRGDCVEFIMRSDEVDSVLVLQIGGGYEIAKDDDSGGGRDALIRGTIRDHMTVWAVATTAQPDEVGRYTFSASTCDGRELPPPPVPVQPMPQPGPRSQPAPSALPTPSQMI